MLVLHTGVVWLVSLCLVQGVNLVPAGAVSTQPALDWSVLPHSRPLLQCVCYCKTLLLCSSVARHASSDTARDSNPPVDKGMCVNTCS